jgi:large subunit ribosomal protein L22
MEVQAITRSVRVSPRKVRIVADAIRELPVDEALVTLHLLKKRGAYALEKTLKSAMNNAVNNAKLDMNNLAIDRIEVTEGQALKRYHASTRGRVHPYKKRSSHIRVVLKEKSIEAPSVAKATDVKKVEKEKGGQK